MKQKAPNKFGGGKRHNLHSVMVLIISPGECDLSVPQAQNTIVRNRDAVRIAPQIIQDFRSVLKRGLAINNPILLRNGIRISKPGLPQECKKFTSEFSG